MADVCRRRYRHARNQGPGLEHPELHRTPIVGQPSTNLNVANTRFVVTDENGEDLLARISSLLIATSLSMLTGWRAPVRTAAQGKLSSGRLPISSRKTGGEGKARHAGSSMPVMPYHR
jgi:hypothetical protein